MTNKTALVTGGARRIGAAICRELHATGMHIIVHFNKSEAAARALVEDLNLQRPGSATSIQADLAVMEESGTLIEKVTNINGRLDVLVNNASIFYPTPLHKIDVAQWQDIMSVNVRAPLFLAQAAASQLQKYSGSIVNLTDIHADKPLPDHLVYSVSKAALVMLTQSLARELAPLVRVNAVSPGAILWPEAMLVEEQAAILDNIALKKQGDTADIAKAVRYLVFDSHYTTGQILTIDGGRSLNH